MGVRRGSFEKVRLQPQVWRQDAIAAHIPMIDAGAGLRAMAEAKKAEGDAEAAKWRGIYNMFDAGVKVLDKYVGIKQKQKERYADALLAEQQYKTTCAHDNSKYSPEQAIIYAQRVENAKKSYESFGVWSLSADAISKQDVITRWINDDKYDTDKGFLYDEDAKEMERLEEEQWSSES